MDACNRPKEYFIENYHRSYIESLRRKLSKIQCILEENVHRNNRDETICECSGIKFDNHGNVVDFI